MEDKKNVYYINIIISVMILAIFFMPRFSGFDYGKYGFALTSLILYFITIAHNKMKIKITDFLYIGFIFIVMIISKNIACVNLFVVLFAKVLVDSDHILLKENVKRSKLLIPAIFSTLLYSLYYYYTETSLYNKRLCHVAIGEVNESGLAIFCFGMILRKKNQILGNIVLVWGIFTFSRNYILALFLFVICNLPFIKKWIRKSKITNVSFISWCTISSVVLYIVGAGFIYLFNNNKIIDATVGINRLFSLFDTSNLSRFSINYVFTKLLFSSPTTFLFGISDMNKYISEMSRVLISNGIQLLICNVPHNFVFSSFRLYGVPLSVCYIGYISSILRRIVTKKNFSIFLAILSYSIILGSGFEAYWLYLSCCTLIMNE